MPRPDGLPEPATAGEVYLAAILDEIRAFRKGGPIVMEDNTSRVKELAAQVVLELKKNRSRR